MYVTRRLTAYKNNPSAATEPPPEGPSSGILVIQDEEAEAEATLCFGLCKDSRVQNLPFPQNRLMRVRDNDAETEDKAFFIPVINQPLASNRYYVIRADRRHGGKTCTCSKEEDMTPCCFCKLPKDVEPTPFNHGDIYQQVEVVPGEHRANFHAKAVASDGIPPRLLRGKNWEVYPSLPSSNYRRFQGEASGLNASLRRQMPELNTPAAVVGNWYCPFIFVKDPGAKLYDQMKQSMFYEMTLQQFWEEIYTCENVHNESKVVEVAVSVLKEMALLNGSEAVDDEKIKVGADGVVWFRPVNSVGTRMLGLSSPIWERMIWEEARGGWVGGDHKVEKVERVEVYEGENDGWKKFACYVFVERFALRRMDGSLALTYDFKHTNKIRIKWE